MPSFNSGSVGRGKVMQRIVSSDTVQFSSRSIPTKKTRESVSRFTSEVVDIPRVLEHHRLSANRSPI